MQLNRFSPAIRASFWGLLLTCLFAFSASAGQKVYTVRRGDTLSGIARDNKLSVAVLAERNGLSRNYHVKVGQRLIIRGELIRLTSFEEFERFLAQPGPWLAGFDFPFGQPRPLITHLHWPRRWRDAECAYSARSAQAAHGHARSVLRSTHWCLIG